MSLREMALQGHVDTNSEMQQPLLTGEGRVSSQEAPSFLDLTVLVVVSILQQSLENICQIPAFIACVLLAHSLLQPSIISACKHPPEFENLRILASKLTEESILICRPMRLESHEVEMRSSQLTVLEYRVTTKILSTSELVRRKICEMPRVTDA